MVFITGFMLLKSEILDPAWCGDGDIFISKFFVKYLGTSIVHFTPCHCHDSYLCQNFFSSFTSLSIQPRLHLFIRVMSKTRAENDNVSKLGN